jgi:hypothetical protein
MSEYTYATEKIDTPAGEYAIELAYDADADNPLTDWDNPGIAVKVDWHSYGGRWSNMVDTLADASDAANPIETWLNDGHDLDDIERRYKKWRAITGSPWQLFTGEDSASRSDWYRWIVLVDTRDYADPEKTARATMDDYATYARGEVTCYTVIDPSGDAMLSVGGFYSDSEALDDARKVVDYEASKRVEKTSLVGAGFVGIL